MHRHIRVSQYISNLICDPTLDSHTCSLVKCCHFSRVSCSTIQRSSVHLQIAAQRSPSTCTNEINTDTHIDPTQSPRAWYVYPQAFESLELEKLFLRFTSSGQRPLMLHLESAVFCSLSNTIMWGWFASASFSGHHAFYTMQPTMLSITSQICVLWRTFLMHPFM